MEKIWLDSYPPGVPETIDPDAYASLRELLDDSFRRFADRPAYSNLGHTLDYADLDRRSRAFGAWLQQQGLQKGDRVALMMPNTLQYPVTLFGVLRAGLTAVNVNPLYTPRELVHQLKDSGARVIVILENFAHTLEQVLPDTPVEQVVITRLGDLLPRPKGWVVNLAVKYLKRMVPRWRIAGALNLPRVLAEGARLELRTSDIGPDDIAFLQYTGGTTGVAKGAVLTHGNIVANILQVDAWLRGVIEEGREVIITALPLYHIFSLTANCLTFTRLGGHNVLITNPRDMPGFVKELRQHRFTVFTGVNTLYNGLLNTPGFDQLDFSHMKASISGGMALQRSVAERWQQLTGKPLLEGYGLTETSPVVCVNPLDLPAYNASIGLPLPSTEIRLCDDQGKALPGGETGELCVRGPQVMRGYWQRPEETAKVLDADGWLHTGDVASVDERGFVRIVDRKKDMILVSGFNVYPNEIEDVLARHPKVLEAAAIGIPDERTGEAIKIFVVAREPDLKAEELVAHCREQLTAYKVPRQVEFRTDLPKTNVGKILRRALREEELKQQDA